MTFKALETSVESGRPVELYYFAIGTDNYYYTSAPDNILFGGNTYLPRQITRTSPPISTEDRRQQIEVTLLTEDVVASRFVGVVPNSQMTLDVFRYHRGDSEAYIMWSGDIVGAAYINQGAQCKFRGVTTETAFGRAIPRLKYQGLCNHVLFGPSCKLINTNFLHTAICSSKSSSTITVNGILAAKGPNWMVSGYVNLNDSDYRLVFKQDGDVLYFYLPFENDPVGETVKCFAGCDHTLVDCRGKFNNEDQYGGFAFVPELNVFVVGM